MAEPRLLSLEAVRDRLYPMVLPPRRAELMGEGRMVARHLAEELAVAYVEDTGPNEIRYITWSDLQAWGLGVAGLHQIALWNLEQKSRPLFPVVMDPPGRRDPMFIWNVQDGYDAARILLHHWIAEVAGLVRGNLLLAVPERHWLVATGDATADKREALRRLTDERFHRATFSVSPLLYVWKDGSLEVLTT